MKEIIEKLEIILNQGLYGREEEVRLALLCTLSNKSLFLYGHDDAKDIQNRFQALFGESPIKAKANVTTNTLKNKHKMNKYTAYCTLGNHSSSDHLYEYLFTQKNNIVLTKLRQLMPEAQKLKKFFQDYDFNQFWNEENKTKAIDFLESLVTHANPTRDLTNDILLDEEDNIGKQLNNISDKRFKDFLHLLAVNLIINGRREITPIDFGMFYYCLRDWSSGVKYLEATICSSLSNEDLPTFVFHDEDYEKQCREKFAAQYQSNASLIPNLEYMFYVPYISSPSTPPHDIFVKISDFYEQYQNLLEQHTNDDMQQDLQELRAKEKAFKEIQNQEIDLKETQLAQAQLKRSAFKSVKDALDEKLKIAISKENEFKEQREILENKFKDAKTNDRREGLESQITEVKAKEEQYKEIRLNLEGQIQEAKNALENKLKQTKDILESKSQEVREKEEDFKKIQEKVNLKLSNKKNLMETKIKNAKEYLTQLRSLSSILNKAIEACQKQIDAIVKPNPVWGNPLKIHLSALRRIQKNLPNMIRVFDLQIKKYEEYVAKSLEM